MTNSPPSLRVTRPVAAKELLRRRQARNALLSFTNYTFPGYRGDAVHALIAATLDRVAAGEIKKLMIFAPPQHGKSELSSVRFPAWWLARRPDDTVILTGYAAELALKHSGMSRAVVESTEYGRLFPARRTRRESRAKDYWQMDEARGGMKAAGVGGPITGFPAQLGLIDDPFESWEQAQSRTYRQRAWDWWRGTFRPRLHEGAPIVLTMTRWHEDDLAGRLLSEQASEWTVLRLPALAETQDERDDNHRRMGLPAGLPDPLGRSPGEALAPTRFSRAALLAIQRDAGSLVWAAEYQGAPRAPEGNRLKRDWFGQLVEAAPTAARRCRYWDKAGTQDGGKYSAGVLLARDADGVWYVEHVVRGQWSAHARESVILQTAQLDAARYGVSHVAVWHEQEPGSGGKESAEATTRMLAGYVVRADPVTGDKDTRLEPFAAQAEAGNVRLVRGAWNAAYIDELCAVPNGTYRDQADATAGAFNKLRSTGKGIHV